MGVLLCPICGSDLTEDNVEAFCKNNHHFDRARQGYINLLMKQTSRKKRHGDDWLMLKSRRLFLEKGYYEELAKKVAETVSANVNTGSVIVDVGCGEGYYSEIISNTLMRDHKEGEMICIDISKEAAKFISKRAFQKKVVVASAFSLPIRSDSCDVFLSVFAPVSNREATRVLKTGGIMVRVEPREYHLFDLKKCIYDVPYDNDRVISEAEGFCLVSYEELDYLIDLKSNADIDSLFKMTPYYYKTSEKDQKKIQSIHSLITRVSFAITVNRKQ